MQHLKRALVSEEEFLSLPESVQKIELIDGEVIVSPSSTLWHQHVLLEIVYGLRQWAEGRPVTVGMAPLDVRFARNRILQPDAMVWLAELPLGLPGPVARIPELCVEVLSRDRVHDRVTKRLLYALAGVKEYWVVDPARVVERWSGPGLDHAEEIRERLESPLLDGFALDLATVFPRT